MKVISVIGITQSGKTTTIENIIKELKRRNYSVGTVKEIHFHAFHMDVEGTNTDRHKKAGAELVTARGEYETDILFQEKLSIDKILGFYTQDYVLLEGVRDSNIPKILTSHDIQGIEDRLDNSVFAISGRISTEISEYKGLPAINSMTDVEGLVDLIEEKAFDTNLSMNNDLDIVLKIGGKEIEMVPFASNILKNIVEGFVAELKGYGESGDIEICIKK
jgi:molybdopterin-guanine dinucleotide biosynthesis protein B